MHNQKISRKISPQLMPATGDEGHQLMNAIGDMGKKRDRILQDKTNVSFVDQVQQKKRRKKHLANMEEKEWIPPHVLTDIDSPEPRLKTHKVQEPKTKPLIVAYPCDIAKFKEQGHLFTRDYFLPIIRAMTLDEKISASLYPSPNYYLGQSDIRPWMRIVLFNWMTEAHLKFKLKEVVLWAAFLICDRFLSKSNINRKKLQLVGCASLWIASKYHEIYPPPVADLVYFSHKAFTKKNIIAMEVRICETLNFQFSIPNALQFLERFTDVALYSIREPIIKDRVKWLARYGMERLHTQVKALKYSPSLLAAGSLFAALKLTSNVWTKSCERCSGYTEEQLNPKVPQPGEQAIFVLIKRAILDFDSQSHQAIITKYKTPERGCVSRLRKKEKRLIKTTRSK